MGKFLTTIVLLLIVVIVGINLVGAQIFSKVLESAIGTPVSISNVNLDVMSSKLSISGIKIQNPDGFKEKYLASIPKISVAYDIPAIFKKTVHVPEVILNIESVSVERNAQNQINLTQLKPVQDAAHGFGKSPKSEQPQAPSEKKPAGEPMEVKIDRVDLTLGEAKYVDSANPSASKTLSLDVNHQILKDVTSPAQITQQIVSIILKKVGMAELTGRLDEIGKGLQNNVTSNLKAGFGGLTDKLKSQVG